MTLTEFEEICKAKLVEWMDAPNDLTLDNLSLGKVSGKVEEILAETFPATAEEVITLAKSDSFLSELLEENEGEPDLVSILREETFETVFPDMIAHFSNELSGNDPSNNIYGLTVSRGIGKSTIREESLNGKPKWGNSDYKRKPKKK